MGTYIRLVDYGNQQEKENAFLAAVNDNNSKIKFTPKSENFSKIPGSPIAYWVSERLLEAFVNGKDLKSLSSPRVGLQTSDNNKYLRLWHECLFVSLFLNCNSAGESRNSIKKWYPHNKGGAYKKWYGNYEYVVDYQKNGNNLRNDPKAATIPDEIVFKPGITFSRLGTGTISFRYQPKGIVFDSAAVVAFPEKNIEKYCLGLLNTKLTNDIVAIIAPTINTQPGDIARVPVLFDETRMKIIDGYVLQNIEICRTDWNSFETSWDFKKSPLI